MKKFSILFASLAIVFAISSAFTTKSTKSVNKYQVFGITNDVVSTASGTAVDAYNNQISDAFNKSRTTSAFSFATEKTAWNASHGIGQPKVRCSADTDQLCGAAIQYDDQDIQNTSTTTFNDVEAGDYSLVP
jgi:hypothetical protein